jgi:outer membrane lipoprotein-sorting protein
MGKRCYLQSGLALPALLLAISLSAQTPEEIIHSVKTKLDKVSDYEASARLKTNVVFIKAPVASVRIFYKRPNKLKINNESGISFIPKGSVNINLNNILTDPGGFDVIDAGNVS